MKRNLKKIIRIIILFALILIGSQISVNAQSQYTTPSWWFGGAAGANFNYYRGTTQNLNSDLTTPSAFYHGKGLGLYLAPLIEYHAPKTVLGFMLQLGYDNRSGKFDQVFTPCNCPADLSVDLTYITIEPSLRIAPFKSNFYIYAGPRFAFNQEKSFTYKQGANPNATPAQDPEPDVKGDLSNVHKSIISMQVGAGIDIPLSSNNHRTQFMLSPFISYHPYFGSEPRSIETWNVSTLRAGIALKFGTGHKIVVPEVIAPVIVEIVAEPVINFTASVPENISRHMLLEDFPLRNYVFFDIGLNSIPNRYMLRKNKEFVNIDMTQDRSKSQMNVYYNILNILGDRMIQNPSVTITLVGSSNNTPKEGSEMSEFVKTYLVTTFNIDPLRINVEGRHKPIFASERRGASELVLLREGDRRVSIESSSPILLMEFQNKIIENEQEKYVSFNAEGSNIFASWILEITDNSGNMRKFGPYNNENVKISEKEILGNKSEGNYNLVMIGQTKNGKIIRKESTMNITSSNIIKNESMTFSVLYEFDNSSTNSIYTQYLIETVIPKIPINGTVMIIGHADIIGGENYNLKLSLRRATDVKNIIEKELLRLGRTDVKFDVSGIGEDNTPFDNRYPEERFYNRTVIIDIK